MRVPNNVHVRQSYYAEVVFCHLPVSTFNSVCLHPAAEEASDLVVAMATVLLGFKRSSEDGRRTRSVGRLYLSSRLSFMSLSSQVPLCFSLRPLRQRAEECGLLAPASSLSSSDPGRVGRVRGGVETKRAEIHCVALLKNVHNSSASLPLSLRGFSFRLLARPRRFFALRERAQAHMVGNGS